jgi:hypothetical protein
LVKLAASFGWGGFPLRLWSLCHKAARASQSQSVRETRRRFLGDHAKLLQPRKK